MPKSNSKAYFAIHVVDQATGRGVPLVELCTKYKTSYYTDSNGYVAFYEPGLMGMEVWFNVRSYGYESPAGPLNTKGVALKTMPGKSALIKLKRFNIAERLYRLTGYGIYRDTVLLGKKPPIAQGLLNAQVTGSDTVQTVIYRGKMYWFWQDTEWLSFAYGNFSMTGATSALPDKLNLEKGIDFHYFVQGPGTPGKFVRPMASIPRDNTLPVWIDGLTVVKDKRGRERLFGRYMVANWNLSTAESGMVIYNDEKEIFERHKKFEVDTRLSPHNHPFRVREGGQNYRYYPQPYANVRVKDDFDSVCDPANYEGFTCLKPGGIYDKLNPPLNRDGSGRLLWTWQRGMEPTTPQQADDMVQANLIKRDETPYQLREADTGKEIGLSFGSIAWNPYLKKWTLLFLQKNGESVLGEVWFAIANAPEGPWRDAKKVATHAMKGANNDFYNAIQHDDLMQKGGRVIYFEGTFVNTFSGNPTPTPYYDYNNILYRLDVADPRLKLPEPPAGLNSVKAISPRRK